MADEGALRELRLEGVSKRFARGGRSVDALCEVDLWLGPGRVVGVFGNNGAGKTTLVRLLCGLVEPSAGRIALDGHALGDERRGVQRRIGLAGDDERAFYPRLSGLENLRLFGALYGLPARTAGERARRWAGQLALGDVLERPFQTWSAGQRQRLNLARALLHEPDVLILDEATRSADPATVDAVRRTLRAQASEHGRLVLYTGHEFRGLEDICDEIVVLDGGRVLLAGPGREVLAGLVDPAWRVRFATPEGRARALQTTPELEADGDERAALWPLGAGAGRSPGLPAGLVALVGRAGHEVAAVERREQLGVRELLLVLAGELSNERAGERGELLRAAGPVTAPADATAAQVAATVRGPGRWRTAGAWRAFGALVRRDLRTEASYRFRVGLHVVLLVAWATMLFLLSQLFDADAPEVAASLHGDAFGFLLFGLAAMQVSQTCLLRMGQGLREEQLRGTVEPLMATGQRPLLLLLGSLGWPLALTVAQVAVLVGLAVPLFDVDLARADWWAVGLAGAVAVVALAALGVLSAACVLAFKRGDPVALLINLASLVLAGAYFPRQLLPQWVQGLTLCLPHTHALNAVRAAALEGAGAADPAYRGPLLALLLTAAVCVPLAAVGWRWAVHYARRHGSLCHA